MLLLIGAAGLLLVGGGVAALTLSGGGPSTPAARRTRRPVVTAPTPVTTSPGPTTVVPRSVGPERGARPAVRRRLRRDVRQRDRAHVGHGHLELRIDPTAGTLGVNLALTGDLYGAGASTQVHAIQGTIQLGNPTAPVVMQTQNFGKVTGQLSGLSIVLTAAHVPDPQVRTFQLSGQLRSDHKGFDATFMVGYRDGRTAQGTASVFCSVSGNRPSQVGTICASA